VQLLGSPLQLLMMRTQWVVSSLQSGSLGGAAPL